MIGSAFAAMPHGRERLDPNVAIPRHRHVSGYIAVVLSGTYVEAGDEGRRRLEPGDALVHTHFDAHLDLIGSRGAEILNLACPAGQIFGPSLRVADPDALVKAVETDPGSVPYMLEGAHGCVPLLNDWPDQLAAALRAQPDLRLDRWAADMRLAPATLSRGFRAVFGTTPMRYRAEARARRAWQAIRETDTPLALIALDHGFADQAHFSRAITALTGASPSMWRRRSNPFKTTAASPV